MSRGMAMDVLSVSVGWPGLQEANLTTVGSGCLLGLRLHRQPLQRLGPNQTCVEDVKRLGEEESERRIRDWQLTMLALR